MSSDPPEWTAPARARPRRAWGSAAPPPLRDKRKKSTVGDGELFVFGVLARQRAQQLHQTLVGFSSASEIRRSTRLSLHVQ